MEYLLHHHRSPHVSLEDTSFSAMLSGSEADPLGMVNSISLTQINISRLLALLRRWYIDSMHCRGARREYVSRVARMVFSHQHLPPSTPLARQEVEECLALPNTVSIKHTSSHNWSRGSLGIMQSQSRKMRICLDEWR